MLGCPCARGEWLVVERVGAELVVYDAVAKRAHAVRPPAVGVWWACSGTRSVPEIAAELGLQPDVVAAAVAEFAAQGLLEQPAERAGLIGRRGLLVGAAALSVPFLVSVDVPVAAAAASSSCSPGQLTAVQETTPPRPGGQPYSVAFNPAGTLLATANQGASTVSVFSVGAGGQLTAVTQTTTPTTGNE